MKAIKLPSHKKELKIILDNEAIDTLIEKLLIVRNLKREIYFSLEDEKGVCELILIPFSLQDKRVAEFYSIQEEGKIVEQIEEDRNM